MGKVSKPFETDLGWHVAKIEEKRPMQAAPLDVVYTRIRKKLEADAEQAYLNKLVEGLDITLRK
ncbi:MAG: hypothetical protein BECKG1743F_GA0114225_100411 [Candidatus Kentron sp. G]|nr:MAG: hypothetical protein BECKG1743F_GA0114225_100411 [Candidatus Kentron sp. G]